MIERDVREYLSARSSQPIKRVVKMVFEASGSELSLRRIASSLGIAVDTVSSYLEACEAAYLLFSCPYFAFSERKQAVRNKKYYPIDAGLRRTVVTQTGSDLGKSLEGAVYIGLRRRFQEIYYWRGKGEVNFVVNSAKGVIPIQVTWDTLQEGHEVALDSFYENFPQAQEAVTVTAQSYCEGMPELDKL